MYLSLVGGNVIIVIGGDDNYKNEEQEERSVISPWARRIVCVQFNEEYLDGRKSFVFSWGKKHRKIHVEALMHFFDPDKNGEKFKCQLPKKADPASKSRRKTRAESIPTEAEENQCHSDIGKITQGKGAFFYFYILVYYIFPGTDIRSLKCKRVGIGDC